MSDEAIAREALAALQPRLRRFALGLCGSVDDAEDLVQSAYERALRRLHQWSPGTRLDSWMYRIVQSLWLNQIEARKVRSRHREREAMARDSLPAGAEEPHEAHLTLRAVRRHLQQIPQEQRVVLLLVAVEGFSYQEAAELLSVPVGTVTSRLGRARRALTERLRQGTGPRADGRRKRAGT